MNSYRVELKPSARRELEGLPDHVIWRVFRRLEDLQSSPRPPRVGDYRVVYTIDDGKRLVEVTRIRHRS